MLPPTTQPPKMVCTPNFTARTVGGTHQGTDVLMNNLTLNWTGDPTAAGYVVMWRTSEDPFWTEVCVPIGAQCGVHA
ncbi:hypothetical protein B0H17DRAFT_1061830 [Mycena rosella]|uniref:Uncharacterized protein n=1 Tax=Mycena rosella TaxID=1033263 RepID=A0AAD7DIH4_MYCRO|nr:hypothetical protein B0H17DRAFT_1061830 [Mycena rosella]